MKAKDTVMTYKQRAECSHNPTQELREVAMCEAQAEISFKIGKTAGVAESLRPALKAIDDSRKAGIREVVEWLREHNGRPDHILDEWQAQLKEWGIK